MEGEAVEGAGGVKVYWVESDGSSCEACYHALGEGDLLVVEWERGNVLRRVHLCLRHANELYSEIGKASLDAPVHTPYREKGDPDD